MSRERTSETGSGQRLLDAWVPPEDAGSPIGCLATTFTFDSVFFEEECLGRFVRLESDPTEDGPIYLLEREEKLAQLGFAAALVDQHHCKGNRSLRWDLLGVRVPGGVQHAKISLLQWSQCIRLIVASANLTPSGYRLNQEVFGVLDFEPNGTAPIEVLEVVIDFLHEIIGKNTDLEANLAERCRGFLDGIREAVGGWAIESPKDLRISAVLVGGERDSSLAQLKILWPGQSPPVLASVVSPFFDQDGGAEDRPTRALWDMLRKRGEARLEFHVAGEELGDEADELFVYAPESLFRAQPVSRPQVSTEFYRITSEQTRPLHAKAIWLENARWRLYQIGSSNFTSHGLGLGAAGGRTKGNLEANLAYVVDGKRHRDIARLMEKAFPAGVPIDDASIHWQLAKEEGEDAPAADMLPLPASFRYAVFSLEKGKDACIELTVSAPPAGWELLHDENGKRVCGENDWIEDGRPAPVKLVWSEVRPPSGFWVRWNNSEGRAWWPVNVDGPASLPPPDELKDLPLDVLISILTSARPLHRNAALRRFLRRKQVNGNIVEGGGDDPPELDPHRRVDTSRFLLQRTRRIGYALSALRDRLERPAYSPESLEWRLRGPVGVMALADAILREAHSDAERAFLVAELALELHRGTPEAAPDALEPETVVKELQSAAGELYRRAKTFADVDESIRTYVERTFKVMAR